MLSSMDLVFVRAFPNWALVRAPEEGTQPLRAEFTPDGTLEGLFLDDDLAGQPPELQWNYARVMETDGNGTVYLDYFVRTRKSVAELFYDVILPGFSDSIPHPDLAEDRWITVNPAGFEVVDENLADFEVVDDNLIAFTVTTGPAGELALNGGAFRVWMIEMLTLEDVFSFMQEAGLIPDFLSSPENIQAIHEKFKLIEE